MTGDTSAGDNATDRIEAALANMQPLRDLASNWDIDIASFLEDYLQDIIGHLDEHHGDSMDESEEGPPNFAQAALLLQNSSHVYSRKVEYLYSLVYAALDDLAGVSSQNKNQRSRTADASIDEFNNFDPDMQFLLLDDVLPTDQTRGGDKINLNEDDNDLDYTRMSSVTQTRMSLGNMSITNLDRSLNTSAANETARNLIGSLSQGTDGGGSLRLLNGNCDIGDHGMLIMPGTAVPGASQTSGLSKIYTETAQEDNDDDGAMMLDDDDDDDGGGFQLAGDDPPPPLADEFEERNPPVVQQAAPVQVEAKKKADPWALLDPHDVGTAKPRPLKIGVTYRLPEGLTEPPSKYVTGSHTRRRTLPTRKPVERPAAPVVSIATETFKATVANRRHQQHMAMTSVDDKDSVDGDSTMNESSIFQTVVARPRVPLKGLVYGNEFAYIAKANAKRKAAERRERRKLLVQEGLQKDTVEEADHLFGFDDHDDDSVGDVQFDDGASNTGIMPFDDGPGSPDARDTSNIDAIEFEALCRAHIKAFAKGAEKYATETNLTKRVGDWQSRLAPILEEEEERPEFNIHSYGERVIEIMEEEIESSDNSKDPKKTNVVSFSKITRGCKTYEICRLFLASLNLSSTGNVAFTSESIDSLEMKLLSSQVDRPMETYMAPSASVSL